MFLISFTPFQPSPGLALWSVLIFLLFWAIMGKLAFKPIINSLKKRENSIADALEAAKKAEEEMQRLTAQNETILKAAQEEKMQILSEARDAKDKILAEAKEEARKEATKIMSDANAQINAQKEAALQEVKNEVGGMAVKIAETLVRQQLSNKQAQEELAAKMIQELSMS